MLQTLINSFTKGYLADFSHQLTEAARSHTGKPAIFHQDFAGNCIERPGIECFSDGIGPERFDCSGLILAALRDSGTECHESQIRHVREMWDSACRGTTFRMTDLAVGAIAVFYRQQTVFDKEVIMPRHIGIVTHIDNPLHIVHANPNSGRVEQRPLKHHRTLMGFIAINPA